MGKYTKILLSKGQNKLMKDKKVHEQVYRESLKKFNWAKKRLLQDFISHPVTKEIAAGPKAVNLSRTLVGGGNLFSFIGFQDSDRPVALVHQFLHTAVTLQKGKPTIHKTKNRIYMGYKVNIPNESQLTSVSSMPWETGSWLYRIERGISGLGYYIYENYIQASRSGTGIQSDHRVKNSVMFKRISYISAILNTFKKNITT